MEDKRPSEPWSACKHYADPERQSRCGCWDWPAKASHPNEAKPGSSAHVALWNAINAYVLSCGGDPAKHVNVQRMMHVGTVEEAAHRWAASRTQEAKPRDPVVWVDEATPFNGPQVKALLDENEQLRRGISAKSPHTRPAYNHTRDDGPHSPCPQCLLLMSEDDLRMCVRDLRDIVGDLRARIESGKAAHLDERIARDHLARRVAELETAQRTQEATPEGEPYPDADTFAFHKAQLVADMLTDEEPNRLAIATKAMAYAFREGQRSAASRPDKVTSDEYDRGFYAGLAHAESPQRKAVVAIGEALDQRTGPDASERILARALWHIVDGHGPASVIAKEALEEAKAPARGVDYPSALREIQAECLKVYATFLRCGWCADCERLDRETMIPMFDALKRKLDALCTDSAKSEP